MSIDRLNQLADQLDLLQDQLAGLEEAKILSPMEEQVRLEQRIKALKRQIQPVAQEYWQTAARSANQLSIAEPEAEVVVGEIVEAVTQIEAYPPPAYSAEILQLLQEILDKLNQPGLPAAAKLKGTLSLIPPFFSPTIETELDVENFFRTCFAPLTRLIRGAAKK